MSQATPPGERDSRNWSITAWCVAGGLIAYLFALYPAFSERSGSSAFGWLGQTWNARNHLEHCYFLPFIALWLVWRKRAEICWTCPQAQAQPQARLSGLIVVAIGALMFVASMRVLQQRVAIASFPFFIVGSALYLGGPRAAQRFLFPASLIYFAVPIPGLLQATNGLQLIATRGAHALANLGGADVVRAGNYISSKTDAWGFDVAEGCSGIRSLMVLTLTAAIIGHLSQDRLWKKGLLLASALPLAVIANAVRVSSVILLAEHGNPEFAASLYHDYSTLVFYPVALVMLLALAGLLRRGAGSRRPGRKVVRVVRPQATAVIGGEALES